MAGVAFSLVTRDVGTKEVLKPTKLEVLPDLEHRDDEASCRRSLRLVGNFPDLAETTCDR